MRRAWSWSAISLALAVPLGAATIGERTVAVAIEGERFTETVHMVVRLETADDVEAWSAFPVYVDDHRSLVSFDARAAVPVDGVMRPGRTRRDRTEVTTEGILHDSAAYELVRFENLRPGAVLTLDYSVRVAPYYPEGAVVLVGDEAVDALAVEVRGGGPRLRWKIEGEDPGLAADAGADRLVLTGYDLASAEPEPYAPAPAGTVLRFAWDKGGTWERVGTWYAELLDPVNRAGTAVAARARALVAGTDDPRERFEALVRFARKEIRYVGVEVGVGGYRPTPAAATLERRWGDCKDKSLLLIDLLAEAGVAAFPALIRLGADSRIDASFPTPGVFNHLIVAVDRNAIPIRAGDPVAGGYFFVDPTQTDGGSRWLHGAVQDQDALVVRDGRGTLVRTPTLPADAVRSLVLDLEVDRAGAARGRMTMTLAGGLAAALAARIDGVSHSELSADLRELLAVWLPGGAQVDELRLDVGDHEVPEVVVRAGIAIDGLLQGRDERRSFRVTGPTATPEPSDVDAERATPLVVRPRRSETVWRLRLADAGCRPRQRASEIERPVGRFTEAVRHEDGRIVVERRAELVRRLIEGPDIASLRELALAEHRAARRRVRLECAPETPRQDLPGRSRSPR